MLLIMFCAALTVLAGIYVLAPLFRNSAGVAEIDLTAETEMDRLADRKTAVYRNLKDLALEYEMGRLSEEDFRQLESGYKSEAAVILQKLEQLGGIEHLEASIEEDIASRKALDPADALKIQGNAEQCPSCGAEIIPGKKFCADCGHKL